MRNPTAFERQIMEDNGVAADGVSVILSNERTIVLHHHKSSCDIMICKGEKPWNLPNSQTPGKKKKEAV